MKLAGGAVGEEGSDGRAGLREAMIAARAKNEQGGGESVGFRCGRQDDGREDRLGGWLPSAGVEDVAKDLAFGLEELAPDG